MSLFSLCLTYTLICQTCLTAPDPGRISQQARRHTDCTIFSHPKSRHRPMQSATLIFLPSLSLSLSYFLCPLPNSPLNLCHFLPSPTASIHICPRSASFKSFLLYHCHAPCCFSPARVSLSSFLPPETLLSLCLFVLLSILKRLPDIFRQAWFSSFKTFLTSSHSLNNMSIKFHV